MMINPLLTSRKTYLQNMKSIVGLLRDKKDCFLTFRPRGYDGQSCLSVGVKLLLGSPSSSNGFRNVQKSVCRAMSEYLHQGEVLPFISDLHIGKQKYYKYYKRHGICTSFSSIFFLFNHIFAMYEEASCQPEMSST